MLLDNSVYTEIARHHKREVTFPYLLALFERLKARGGFAGGAGIGKF
jgi:hypothetical protein